MDSKDSDDVNDEDDCLTTEVLTLDVTDRLTDWQTDCEMFSFTDWEIDSETIFWDASAAKLSCLATTWVSPMSFSYWKKESIMNNVLEDPYNSSYFNFCEMHLVTGMVLSKPLAIKSSLLNSGAFHSNIWNFQGHGLTNAANDAIQRDEYPAAVTLNLKLTKHCFERILIACC